ncbi:hypothetical protein HDU76_001216 [Blyttiomyces sp. JEL0837]|nr:hypothetical protein HDU76_001216 [Blyttiomyces sp. JEL0837]
MNKSTSNQFPLICAREVAKGILFNNPAPNELDAGVASFKQLMIVASGQDVNKDVIARGERMIKAAERLKIGDIFRCNIEYLNPWCNVGSWNQFDLSKPEIMGVTEVNNLDQIVTEWIHNVREAMVLKASQLDQQQLSAACQLLSFCYHAKDILLNASLKSDTMEAVKIPVYKLRWNWLLQRFVNSSQNDTSSGKTVHIRRLIEQEFLLTRSDLKFLRAGEEMTSDNRLNHLSHAIANDVINTLLDSKVKVNSHSLGSLDHEMNVTPSGNSSVVSDSQSESSTPGDESESLQPEGENKPSTKNTGAREVPSLLDNAGSLKGSPMDVLNTDQSSPHVEETSPTCLVEHVLSRNGEKEAAEVETLWVAAVHPSQLNNRPQLVTDHCREVAVTSLVGQAIANNVITIASSAPSVEMNQLSIPIIDLNQVSVYELSPSAVDCPNTRRYLLDEQQEPPPAQNQHAMIQTGNSVSMNLLNECDSPPSYTPRLSPPDPCHQSYVDVGNVDEIAAMFIDFNPTSMESQGMEVDEYPSQPSSPSLDDLDNVNHVLTHPTVPPSALSSPEITDMSNTINILASQINDCRNQVGIAKGQVHIMEPKDLGGLYDKAIAASKSFAMKSSWKSLLLIYPVMKAVGSVAKTYINKIVAETVMLSRGIELISIKPRNPNASRGSKRTSSGIKKQSSAKKRSKTARFQDMTPFRNVERMIKRTMQLNIVNVCEQAYQNILSNLENLAITNQSENDYTELQRAINNLQSLAIKHDQDVTAADSTAILPMSTDSKKLLKKFVDVGIRAEVFTPPMIFGKCKGGFFNINTSDVNSFPSSYYAKKVDFRGAIRVGDGAEEGGGADGAFVVFPGLFFANEDGNDAIKFIELRKPVLLVK